jgi:membrane peptidoglycan carboxypeptidase
LIRVHQDLFRIDGYARVQYVDYPETLTLLEKMVLVGEDRRFFWHNGIDWRSVIRETLRKLTFRRHGGASTIDMQFVRMATGYYEKTVSRKIYEMLLAILIQFRYQKIEILRYYLNHAFFGSHLDGATRASRALFNKHPDYLSLNEAAQLAAMLVYPRPRQPTPDWSGKVARRSRYIQAMLPRFEKRFDKLPSWKAI